MSEVVILIILLTLFLSLISWAVEKIKKSKVAKITNNVLDALYHVASGINHATSEMEKNVSEWAEKKRAERASIAQTETISKPSVHTNKIPETRKMSAWDEWKLRNRAKLNEHPYDYEEMFVNIVLMKIAEIQPSEVVSQYHFLDNNGKNRYIDFVIENKAKNWLLPIELDGYTKMQMGYEKFDDFLARQNALIKQFSIVLRYSNKKFRDHPDLVISEIRETLRLQQQGKIISKPAIERLKEEIEKLKAFLAKAKQANDKKIINIIEDHEKQIKIFEEKERKHQEKLQKEQEKRVAAERKQEAAERERQDSIVRQKRAEEARQEALEKQLVAETEWREASLIAMEAEKKYQEEKRKRERIEEELEDELCDRPSNNNKWLYAGCFLFAGISLTAATVYFFERKPTSASPRIEQITNSEKTNPIPQQSPLPVTEKTSAAIPVPTPQPVVIQSSIPVQTVQIAQPVMDYIAPDAAKNHIGEIHKICGNVVEVKTFSKGVYLNFEEKYPNQHFTAVIWKNNKALFHQSAQFGNEYICVSGKIEAYHQKPQIIIKSASQIYS